MRKSLRSLALVALAALPFAMSAQLNIRPIWVNGVSNGVANPIPNIDGGWGKPTASNSGDKTVCRFAVGKNGKLLFNNHKENAIMAWDGKAWSTYAKLPAVTTPTWDGMDKNPDGIWNGTAISADDAGNVIYNYCFINNDKSLKYWGVIAADGTITDIELSTPLAELGSHGRLDIISHIVGDVNSEKGGIGYATTDGKSNNVVMFHFKGNGTKVTSLTAKSFEVVGLESNGLYVPSPKYLTIDELLANGTPEKEFYVPYGGLNTATLTNGTLASGDETLTGYGNRQYNTSAVFTLAGKKYIVRSYVSPENPKVETLTGWKCVMTFGIFDLENGECVASWQGSEFSNANGMGTITAEPVDENTVNVYMYVVTGTDDAATGTQPGGYGGMFKVTPKVGDEHAGTEEDPYIIATVDDLCDAYLKIKENINSVSYFKQTADIDMADVKDWHPINGFNGVYTAAFHYDGQNHVIRNFSPEVTAPDQPLDNYYMGTIFGVLSGSVKNLGIINANVVNGQQGGGFIAAYAGHNDSESLTEGIARIENVFVSGTYDASANPNYIGGLVGTTGGSAEHILIIENCFVNADIKAQNNVAGFVGRLRNDAEITESYVAGTISGTGTNVALAFASDKAPAVIVDGVYAFNTGADETVVGADPDDDIIVAAADDAEAIEDIQSWSAFDEGYLFLGLPALNWMGNMNAGFNDAVIENNDAPAVYYNLQGVQVANPDNGIYIVRRGNKATKELIRK